MVERHRVGHLADRLEVGAQTIEVAGDRPVHPEPHVLHQLGAGLLQLGNSYLDLNELRSRSLVHAERLEADVTAGLSEKQVKRHLKTLREDGAVTYDTAPDRTHTRLWSLTEASKPEPAYVRITNRKCAIVRLGRAFPKDQRNRPKRDHQFCLRPRR